MRKNKIYAGLLMVLLSFIICTAVANAQTDSSVTVFIVDTKVDFSFVRNLTMTKEINHGSAVGRIIYQEVPEINLLSYSVDKEGEISKALYYDALKKIADYQEQHPNERIIVNVSLGFSKPSDEHKSLIDELVSRGVVVIAAAGNDSSHQAIYPAGFKGTIAVGNATKKGKAASSNYGEFIDLCASGSVKYISRLYLPQGVTVKSFKAVGTSFSAPRVVALLAKSLVIEPNLSVDRALDLISNNADAIADEKYEEGLLGTGVINKDRTLAQVDSYYYLKTYGLSFLWGLLILGIAIYWLQRYHWGVLFLVVLLLLVVLPLAILVQEIIVGNAGHILNSYQQLQMIDWFALILAPVIIIKLTTWKKSFIFFNYLLAVIVLSLGMGIMINPKGYWIFYWRCGLFLSNLFFIFGEQWRIYQAESGNDIYRLTKFLSSQSQKIVEAAKYQLQSSNYSVQRLLGIFSQVNAPLDLVEEIVRAKVDKAELIDQLLTILKQRDEQLEDLVIQLLNQLNSEEILTKVKLELTASQPQIQYILLRLLAKLKIKDKEVMQEIITILFSDSDMWLRYQALITLTAVSSSVEELELIIAELRFDSQEIIRLEAQNLWSQLEN